MHFVGMLAYKLPIAVNYDVFVTIVSIIPAIFSSYVVLQTSTSQSISSQAILWRSVMMGGGIGLMHYTGMAAMHMDGVMRYNPVLFILSLIVAFILSGISLFFKLKADKHIAPGVIFSWQILLPAIVMGCAISGMHYTGMAALSVFPESTKIIEANSWTTETLVNIISGITILLGILLIIAIEVSHRLTLYRRIAQSESQVRILLDSTAEAIYGIDRQGKCTFVNQSCIDMLGYDDSELLGQNMHDLIHYKYADGSPYPVDKCHIYRAFKHEVGTQIDNEVLWRKDGSSFSCKYWSHPVIEDNKCTGAVVTFIDTTEQNIIEETLRRTQKMDALGKLTGGVAHDFNNLLGIVLGYADLLQSNLGDNPELLGYVKHIFNAGERGSKLTKSLLAFSRKKSSDAEELNLNSLLHNQQDMLKKTLTARIKLVLDLEDNLWPVFVDSSDLEDAILNMCINAMHAIDGNGHLTIQTQNINLANKDANLFDIPSGDYIILRITDDGAGMEQTIKEKIFEPFFTTKSGSGTGLGLSQVYGFVDRCHGTIEVNSTPDHGTSFALYFPRYEDINKSAKDIEKVVSIENGTETILVVDDEPALVSMSSQFLSRKGYTVLTAYSAKEALDVLAKELVDVLFSDIIMPEMDGYELAAIVKEKYPSVKIQLVSGFSREREQDSIDDELQKNILLKPYNSKKLYEKIRSVIDS